MNDRKDNNLETEKDIITYYLYNEDISDNEFLELMEEVQ